MFLRICIDRMTLKTSRCVFTSAQLWSFCVVLLIWMQGMLGVLISARGCCRQKACVSSVMQMKWFDPDSHGPIVVTCCQTTFVLLWLDFEDSILRWHFLTFEERYANANGSVLFLLKWKRPKTFFKQIYIVKDIFFSVKRTSHWSIAIDVQQAGQSTSLCAKHWPLCLSLAWQGKSKCVWSHYSITPKQTTSSSKKNCLCLSIAQRPRCRLVWALIQWQAHIKP